MFIQKKGNASCIFQLIRCLFLGLALSLIASACCVPAKIGSVGVGLVPQHRDWWCWAATTEMISSYFGHRIDQCQSANFVHGTPPDCCTGCTGDCPCWGSDWGASIGDIKNNWTHWNFDYTYIASSLQWQNDNQDDLRDTISPQPYCKSCPIQVIWWWYPNPGFNGGHVVTAYGYAEIGTSKYVSYFDPWPPDCEKNGNICSSVSGGEDVVTTYDAFVDDGVHQWGDSFYDFHYTGK